MDPINEKSENDIPTDTIPATEETNVGSTIGIIIIIIIIILGGLYFWGQRLAKENPIPTQPAQQTGQSNTPLG